MSAMPTAMSLTRGREHTEACRAPRIMPAIPATRTPSHGHPVRYETPYPLIAPITSVPSRPRLIRPLFSVRHSPRLTKRNGVLPRMAPPRTARGTPHHPSASTSGGLAGHDPVGWRYDRLLENAEPPIRRFAGENDQEDDAAHHVHRRVRQIVPPLQQAPGGIDAAEQDSHRDHCERILPGEKGHEDPGVTVADHERCAGPAVNGGDLRRPGETGCSPRDQARDQRQPADWDAGHAGGTHVATDDPGCEPEYRVLHQHVRDDAPDDAEDKAPVDVHAWDQTDHVALAHVPARRSVEDERIAHWAAHEVVHQGDGDIVEKKTADRLVDAPVIAQAAGETDPEPARRHTSEHHRGDDRPVRSARKDRRDRYGGERSDDQGALGADHDEPEPSRQGGTERGEHQRRRPLQRVLPGEPASEGAAVDRLVHPERVGSGQCHEHPEKDEGHCQSPRGDGQRLGGPSRTATEQAHQLRVDPLTPSTSQSIDSSQMSVASYDLPAGITVLPVLSFMGPL